MDVISTLTYTVIFLFAPPQQNGMPPIPIGTGFIIQYPIPASQNRFVPLIVTAKHVLSNHTTVLARFNTKKGESTAFVEYDLSILKAQNDYWEHQDQGVDISIFRTPHFDHTKYEAIPGNLISSRDIFKSEDVKQADRVIFPGLLVNFFGGKNNYPILKDGSIALIPQEKVPMEYRVGSATIKTTQEVILINTISIPGLSGSPVFLWPGPRLKKNTFTFGGQKPYLLGIMHGFYNALPREVTKIETTESKYIYQDNSGVAIVFPSWRINEILELTSFKNRMEEIIKSSKPTQDNG